HIITFITGYTNRYTVERIYPKKNPTSFPFFEPFAFFHVVRYNLRLARWPKPHLPEQRSGRRRSEEHTSELQSRENLVCRLLLEKIHRPPSSTLFPYTTLFRSHIITFITGYTNRYTVERIYPKKNPTSFPFFEPFAFFHVVRYNLRLARWPKPHLPEQRSGRRSHNRSSRLHPAPCLLVHLCHEPPE